MKIDLLNVPVYYINLNDQDQKRKQTETMLKQLGFKYVERFNAIRHDAGRIIGCARSHHAILSMNIKPPFIVIEDDCAINKKFPEEEVEIPDDVDGLYLGISHWGRYMNHSGPYVHAKKVDNVIMRVYNMLATHAIGYFSNEYIDICKRVAYHHGYEIENHVDIGFAEIQKFYNVYCFDEPLFRQYEWNAVTTGKISENSYNQRTSNDLYDSILTDDESYYRIGNTQFKSPIKELIMKRDISGIPGMFLPSKLF